MVGFRRSKAVFKTWSQLDPLLWGLQSQQVLSNPSGPPSQPHSYQFQKVLLFLRISLHVLHISLIG